MTGRTVLITGANKSIGYETARQLGRLGYRIWLGSRDAGRGALAAETLSSEGIDVRAIAIDVTDDDSVQSAAATVQAADGKLDVLINNAGIPGRYAAPGEQNLSEIETVYQTNVFGPIRVTQAFAPLLKAADNARVVNMSSGVGSLTLITDPTSLFSTVNLLAYTSSKVALNAVTVSFAKEFEPFEIKVNAVEPGHVRTDLNGNSGFLTPEEGAETAIKMALIDKSGPTGGFFGSHGRQPW